MSLINEKYSLQSLIDLMQAKEALEVELPTLCIADEVKNWPGYTEQQERYKYPLEENVKENEAEDQRCLAKVEELLEAGEYVVFFFHPFLYLFSCLFTYQVTKRVFLLLG